MPRRAVKRRDANHHQIVKELKQCGFSVLDLSQVGDGCPDLLIGRNNEMMLVEIKVRRYPGSKKLPDEMLSKRQERWRNSWRGARVLVADSAEQILREYALWMWELGKQAKPIGQDVIHVEP